MALVFSNKGLGGRHCNILCEGSDALGCHDVVYQVGALEMLLAEAQSQVGEAQRGRDRSLQQTEELDSRLCQLTVIQPSLRHKQQGYCTSLAPCSCRKRYTMLTLHIL